MSRTWSDRAWAEIGRLVAAGEDLGLSGRDLERFVRKGFPWGTRANWLYKVWLREVRRCFVA